MGQAEDRGRGVYAISVAAELVGTGQQNLRLYERKGLLEPGRTLGGTRQYSEDDLVILRRIGELLDLGLNLAGIRMVLLLEADNRRLEGALRSANAPRDTARHPVRRG
ncbi:MerR family transcriptional regulator [Arthrobacter sp. efr-133-TYG-118]|uniref:MerR family transcriptional regulator n=1 Tax=Arthrobacter sp. efr-133-TYG-118 TaxID=3040279 RepID=UPI00254E4C19|nr:MerR family transcriptional regulator [Arthrobacter sp. efr-133-TYG-118]